MKKKYKKVFILDYPLFQKKPARRFFSRLPALLTPDLQ